MTDKKFSLPKLKLSRINGQYCVELSGGHSLDYMPIREDVEKHKFSELLSNIEVLYSEDKLYELQIFDTQFLNFNGIVYNSLSLRLTANCFLENFYGYENPILTKLYIQECKELTFKNIHKYSLDNLDQIYVDNFNSNILGLMLLPKLKNVFSYSNSNNALCKLIHDNLQNDRDVLEFQEQLITNGYSHLAKL